MEKDRPPDLRVVREMVAANDAGVMGTVRMVRPDNSRHPDMMREMPNRKQRRKMQRDYQAKVAKAQKEAAANGGFQHIGTEVEEVQGRDGAASRSLTELAALKPLEEVSE